MLFHHLFVILNYLNIIKIFNTIENFPSKFFTFFKWVKIHLKIHRHILSQFMCTFLYKLKRRFFIASIFFLILRKNRSVESLSFFRFCWSIKRNTNTCDDDSFDNYNNSLECYRLSMFLNVIIVIDVAYCYYYYYYICCCYCCCVY